MLSATPSERAVPSARLAAPPGPGTDLANLSVAIVGAKFIMSRPRVTCRNTRRICSDASAVFEFLLAAATLPGKSLQIALLLLALGHRTQALNVELSNKSARRVGIDRTSKYRALAYLEHAGLIGVVRKPGRSPSVTLHHRKHSP